MKWPTARTTVLALLALACDTTTEPGTCPESVAAVVAHAPGGAAPEFGWSPSCRISWLEVSGAHQDQVFWIVESRERGFLPGIAYGDVPSGATEIVPAVPLVAGGEYYLTLGTVIGGDAIVIHAMSLFTR